MSEIPTVEELLDAGCHFGHRTARWHPKFAPYIFGARHNIYIIDLNKTRDLLQKAAEKVRNIASSKGNILFVGTKKQAQRIVTEEAKRCGAFYVTHRWLGGMLTNFHTIRQRVAALKELEKMAQDNTYQFLTKKERHSLEKKREWLTIVLSGIRDMTSLPRMLYVVDAKAEINAVREAKKLGIPVVAMVDSNTDPTIVDYPIPTNDDAIRAIGVITRTIADAYRDGRSGGEFYDMLKGSEADKGSAEAGEAVETAPPAVDSDEQEKTAKNAPVDTPSDEKTENKSEE